MKTLIISILIVTVTVHASQSQTNHVKDTLYGFSISQFKSGSGFQSGYEFQISTQISNKSKLGFGIFTDNESQKKFSGLTVSHQRFLFTKRNFSQSIHPSIFYNFIYRVTETYNISQQISVESELPDIARYSSMEHHVGIAFSINILKNVFLDCGLGYGFYFGSIKHPSKPDAITGIVSGTNGNAFILKSGIGFNF